MQAALTSVPALAPRASVSAGRLGWLAPLSVTAATGLLLVSLADGGARGNAGWAELLFWLGLLIAFAPITARLLSASPAREERIGLLALLGVVLYLVKVFHSPIGFTFHDEFVHWRNVQNAMDSGHLFESNPLLPVSADFPGLTPQDIVGLFNNPGIVNKAYSAAFTLTAVPEPMTMTLIGLGLFAFAAFSRRLARR